MNSKFIVGSALCCLSAASFASPHFFTGTFSGLNESPPVITAGTGTTLVTIDDVTKIMTVNSTFSGLTGTTTASHIHARANSSTANGGVATQTPSFAGFPLGVTSGVHNMTYDMSLASSWNPAFITANGGTTATAFTAFFAKMQGGLTYLNIHTSFAPGGEVRANLVETVPEPTSMIALGLGAAALLRRKVRKA